MRIALWIVQGLLAAAFLMAGMMKATTPFEELATNMSWVNSFSPGVVRFIGISEVIGALGLIIPAATRIKPVLTPVAASALALVMLLAAITHVGLGEFGALVPTTVLGGLAAFVAWGRFKKAPIQPRGASASQAVHESA